MKIAFALLAAILLISGCASQQPARGSSKMVEASRTNKPDWVEKRLIEQTSDLYFVGTIASVKDLTLGEEQAEYQAKKTIASSIQESFEREFSSATSGSNATAAAGVLGQRLESALSASTSRVQVRGIVPVERYWERVETVTDDGVASSFNVAVMVRLSRAEYDRARRLILEDAAKADQFQADRQAQEVLDRVRNRLQAQ